ncbi:cationic amino acid transporter 4 [Periophthalmus magnuspinnatus]|uniref:cationic amino acid transporter 4 n=1 Tax=Periophthalmus magnuspinnatus TaxID=409849 RepID=UPI00145AABEC|nr:cationic amino acid transporter 4 [Periophthalmus magnuspinnatus]
MASCQRGCAPIVRLCQKVNRLKTLEDDMMATSLKRCLNTLDLTLMGVGGMVGSGLYVLTGTVAKNMVGPAVILSFAIAGFASLLSALCYAEFGARIPKTGSAYMFTYVSVGEVWAFLIGWNVVLENMIGGAATARAWSGYLDSVFNHAIQNYTESHIMSWNVPFLAHYPDLLAAGILLVASLFISFGVQVSSYLNHIFSLISMCVIVFVLVFGFMLAEPANWSPKEGGFAPFGLSGILAGSASCFYAFVGFDVIASSSEEAKNPQKAIPIATAVSLALAATAYILVSTVLTLIVPWYSLDPDSALSDAFFRRGYSWAGLIVVIGSLCAMSTVLLCNLYSLPRIIYAMAEDGLFFSFFARVNPVTKVPVNAILVFGFFMSIIALIFDLQALVQFLSIGTLLAYTFVAASVIVLRFQPEKATVKNGISPNANAEPSPAPSESQTFKEDSGELKQYESFSDKLQLVERTKVKERRAAGQLKACYEPYLGRFVGDFEPGEVVAFCVLILLVSAASLSAVLTFGNQPLELPLWSFSMLIVIFSLAFVISLALIWAHEPQKDTKTFQVPLVPLIPGASILVNVFLMMKFSAMTWIRFAVWIGIGLVVYFGYGIWHSKEGRRELHTTDMAARYVVLPSGSLVETVQSVQPDGQVEPSGPHVNTGGEFEEKR